MPQIDEVPDSIVESERAPLRVVQTKPAAMRDALRLRLAEHNTRCRSVKVGSAEEQVCRQDQSRLIQEREQYVRAVNKFNDMIRPWTGENLGPDQKKWELAIQDGKVQAAIEKALTAGVKRGELTQAQAEVMAKILYGPAMVIEAKDNRLFLALPIRVPPSIERGEECGPTALCTFKYSPLRDGVTLDSVALSLVRTILADRNIVTKIEALAAPGR